MSDFWTKLIWFAHNGIITIHCNATIITAGETFVHQIHHEWFHYSIQCYQWGTCSSFLYHSKTQNRLLCFSWRQAPINTLTHCMMPVRRCVCACVCYSLSIKFTQSRDRTGRIQRLKHQQRSWTAHYADSRKESTKGHRSVSIQTYTTWQIPCDKTTER